MQRSWGKNELGVFQRQKEGHSECRPINSMKNDVPKVEGESRARLLGHEAMVSTLNLIPKAVVYV